ncbi:MAG: hypothetical protein ACE361_12750 [Aureliella sp.]
MGTKVEATRIAVIADSYWPVVSGGSLRVRLTVDSLLKAGFAVDVITPKPAKSWPSYTRNEDAEVYRFDESSVMGLPLSRASREVDRLISRSQHNYDAIYLDRPGRQWESLVRRLTRKQCPLLVRFDPEDYVRPDANPAISEAAIEMVISSVQSADAILAPNAEAERRATSLKAQVIRVDERHEFLVDRSIGVRREVRRSFGDASHELMTSSADRILLSIATGQDSMAIRSLLRQVGLLTEKNRQLRWWILGHLPDREELYQQLKNHGWQYAVTMPGVITDIESALQIADLVLVASPTNQQSTVIDICVQNRVPYLVSNIISANEEPGKQSVTAAPLSKRVFDQQHFDANLSSGEGSLRDQVETWLDDPSNLENRILALQNDWFAKQNSPSGISVGEAVGKFLRALSTKR